MVREFCGKEQVLARGRAAVTHLAAMETAQRTYDAAVVGSGVVGLATALAIAKAKRQVALLAPAPPRRQHGALGSDLRTVAVNAASLRFLREAGLPRGEGAGLGERDGRVAAIQTMRVWEHDGGASLHFRQTDGSALAWVAETGALATALWQAAVDRVDVVPAAVTGIAQGEGAATLALADGASLRARLVVAADGAASPVRHHTATRMRAEPPFALGAQTAIATVARLAEAHGRVAWQRFGRNGPLALLPLADSRAVSVIWSGATVEQERRMAFSDDQFRAALQAETEGAAGEVLAVDRRLAFPVQQAVAANVNPWQRVVLAGDAARTLHPLAGQGVNIGLEDARRIAAEAAAGGDLGAAGRWRAYAANRRRRSKLMVALMRGLLEAYCGAWANGPWLRWARNATLRRIDASAAVKEQLMREAMGFGALAA